MIEIDLLLVSRVRLFFDRFFVYKFQRQQLCDFYISKGKFSRNFLVNFR